MERADLLDHAPAGYLAFDDDGRILRVNATLLELLGYDALEGRPLELVLTIPSRVFHQTHLFPLLKLHGEAREIYLTLRHASGRAVHVLVNAARREHAGVMRSDCVMMPIHERQKYEEQLLLARRKAEEAYASMTRFLSAMSHDLRTPLGAIGGYADMLMLGIRGDMTAEQRADVERIKHLSQSLLRMVDDLLQAASADATAPRLRLEPLRLTQVLDTVESAVMPAIGDAGIAYSRTLPDPELTVLADGDHLQRILVNLVGNAVKFTPRGGRIGVSATAAADRVLIQVSDTGPGIPGDRIGEIFKPFVQLESAPNQARSGVGLGLAISREFARAMAGEVDVVSAPGEGSVFTVTLGAG